MQPDVIICRSSLPVNRSTVSKISLFCMVPATHVVSVHDVSNLYKVPLLMLAQRLPALVLNVLKINRMPPEKLPSWQRLSDKVEYPKNNITIALVGKYTGLTDSYLSVTKALFHAAIDADLKLKIEWIESSKLEVSCKAKTPKEYEDSWALLKSCDGILIPGGFGDRGVEGKVLTAQYARLNNVPFLGICLGMQVHAVVVCACVCVCVCSYCVVRFERVSPCH